MKLLTKQQINTTYQDTRRKEIEEGVKLAKKVDTLRETLSSLEAQHKAFLAGMSRELEEKTKSKQQHIALLESEVKKLEERKKTALEPLDKEWQKLEEKIQDYRNRLSQLQDTERELQIQKDSLQKEETLIQKEKENLENQKTEIERTVKETNLLFIDAKDIKDKNETEYNAFVSERKEVSKQLQEKENELRATINYQQKKEKELKNKEIYLQKLEIKLKDRSDRLKQTLKELNLK